MEQFYSHQWEPWNYTPLHSSCFDSTNGPFSFSPRMYNDPFEQSYDIGNVYNAQQQCKYDSSFQTYNSDLHYRNSQEVPMHSEDCLPYVSDYHSPPNYMPSPNPFSHDYTVPNSHDNDLREIRDMLNTFASNALAMQQSTFSHDYTVPNSHDNDLREIRDMLNTFAYNALAMQQSITDFQ